MLFGSGPNDNDISPIVRTPDPSGLLADDIQTFPNPTPVPFTFAPHEANNPNFLKESNPGKHMIYILVGCRIKAIHGKNIDSSGQ